MLSEPQGGRREGDQPEDLDLFEVEELEALPCNFTYVAVCILLPFLNGQLHAFHLSGLMLHYEDMGWPLFRAGLALSLGFGTRVLVQQLVLISGYWMAVPAGIVHLTFAVLAIIYTNSEWAVMAEIICTLSLDTTCAIEGISFDSFGSSELLAMQASSTALSVFTIAVAFSVTIGGVVYDTLGWRGVATYHSIVVGSLVLILVLQPGCRKSFMETFFSEKDPEMQPESAQESAAEKGENMDPQEGSFVAVLPAHRVTLPGVVEELQLQDAEDEDLDEVPAGGHGQVRPSHVSHKSRQSGASHRSRQSAASQLSRHSALSQRSSRSKASHNTHITHVTHVTKATGGTANTDRSKASSKGSNFSVHSTKARNMNNSIRSSRSRRTGRTGATFLPQITSLSTAGQDFSCHFATKNALQPFIAGATGSKQVVREELDIEEDDNDEGTKKSPAARASIPKDLRLPAFLIVMNAFLNNTSYAVEFSTFAIFFKQVHNWNEATLASVAQTAGDLLAAIAMQVMPRFFEGEYDPDEAGCLKRLWHKMTSQPYNLTFLLATWVLFNFGLLSPVLALGIISQIFMGTTYVYSSKWTTEMNLFYSLGDQNIFMSLQVLCRNAEAIGGCLAGILGTWLYTLHPLGPFIFTTSLSFLAFSVYTLGFCSRLGCDFDDIETAEEQRARKKGVRRVVSWMSDTQNTQRSRDTKAIRFATTDLEEDAFDEDCDGTRRFM